MTGLRDAVGHVSSTAQHRLAMPEGKERDDGQGDPDCPKQNVPLVSEIEQRVARGSIVHVHEVHAKHASEELERQDAHRTQREDVENVLLPVGGGRDRPTSVRP